VVYRERRRSVQLVSSLLLCLSFRSLLTSLISLQVSAARPGIPPPRLLLQALLAPTLTGLGIPEGSEFYSLRPSPVHPTQASPTDSSSLCSPTLSFQLLHSQDLQRLLNSQAYLHYQRAQLGLLCSMLQRSCSLRAKKASSPLCRSLGSPSRKWTGWSSMP